MPFIVQNIALFETSSEGLQCPKSCLGCVVSKPQTAVLVANIGQVEGPARSRRTTMLYLLCGYSHCIARNAASPRHALQRWPI